MGQSPNWRSLVTKKDFSAGVGLHLIVEKGRPSETTNNPGCCQDCRWLSTNCQCVPITEDSYLLNMEMSSWCPHRAFIPSSSGFSAGTYYAHSQKRNKKHQTTNKTFIYNAVLPARHIRAMLEQNL